MNSGLPEINNRIKQLINHYTGGKVAPFADMLNGISQQKLNRLFNIDTRTSKYPLATTDILVAITEKFVDVNADWLLKGQGEMLHTSALQIRKEDNTPVDTSKKQAVGIDKSTRSVPPTNIYFVPPTVPPTQNLGVPQVVTVTEDDRELISLVPHKAAAGYLNGYADPEYVESLPTIRLPNLGAGTHRAFEIKGHSMNPTLHNGSMSIGRWVESFEDIRDRRIYIVVTKSEGIVTKRVLNRINESGKLILISDNQNKKDYPNILLDADDVLELWYQRANLSFEFPEPDLIHNRMNDTEARLTLLEDKIKHLLK